MRRVLGLIFWFLFAFSIESVCFSQTQRVHKQLDVGPILVHPITIGTNRPVIETAVSTHPLVASSNPDSHMYLFLRPNAQYPNGKFVGENDDALDPSCSSFGTLMSCIRTSSLSSVPAGQYFIIVRTFIPSNASSSPSSEGGVDLKIDGVSVLTQQNGYPFPFAYISGTKIFINGTSTPNQIVTAMAPSFGVTLPGQGSVMIGLNCNNAGHTSPHSFDIASGPSGSKVEGLFCQAIVGHYNVYDAFPFSENAYMRGMMNSYVNDLSSDSDGDSLGDLLEAELGTCGGTSSDPAYCAGVWNKQDSDTDGLGDFIEVLGRPYVLLPRYGAEPLQKDVFLEVDYIGMVATPITEDNIKDIWDALKVGPSAHLRNPNGKDGVRIHMDVGISPIGSSHPHSYAMELEAVYGDWGGSNRAYAANADEINAGTPAANYMSADRQFIFRHVSLHLKFSEPTEGACFGQSNAPSHFFRVQVPAATNFNPNNPIGKEGCPSTFIHEMGHSLGLRHWGHSKLNPKVNGIPSYKSIMSYAFDSEGFYLGAKSTFSLNPSILFEGDSLGVPGINPVYLQGPPFFYLGGATNNSIDWDRNSTQTGISMRYGITFTSGTSSGTTSPSVKLAQKVEEMPKSSSSDGSPDLVAYRDGSTRMMFGFFIKDGSIRYTHGAYLGVPNNKGSCPGGDKLYVMDASGSQAPGDECTDWSIKDSTISAESVAAYFAWGKIFIAYRKADSLLYFRSSNSVSSSGSISWSAESIVSSSAVLKEPEFSWVNINGSKALGLFALSVNGDYVWTRKTTPGQAWTALSTVSSGGIIIKGRTAPGLVMWPDVDHPQAKTCGVFPGIISGNDDAGSLRFYCFEEHPTFGFNWKLIPDAFKDVGASSMNTYSKPSIAFRTLRRPDGAEINASSKSGQFWLSRTYVLDDTAYIATFISVAIDLNTDLSSLNSVFDRNYYFHGGTFGPPKGTGAALYIDPDLSALRGIYQIEEGNNVSVRIAPFVDGTFNADLKTDSDFKIMSGNICRGVSSAHPIFYCPAHTQTFWKY